MIRTFLDSGVLLTAWKGKDPERAWAIMEDPEREFVTSQFVRLERIPKAAYHKQRAEARLYEGSLRYRKSRRTAQRRARARSHGVG